MTSLQKVIKYGAIAFGFYLVFVILSAIIFSITAVFGISTGLNSNNSVESNQEITFFEESYENVNNLDIKLDVSKLNIKNGNEFKVEVTNPTNKFYCKIDGDTLKIRDERKNVKWFNFSHDVIPEIVIYIPDTFKLNEIEIDTGVSETNIEQLVANEVDIQIGVGKFVINNIVTKKAKISGGAGEANINKSSIDVLKLDAGIGKFAINSKVSEEAKIEAGVGQLILNLQGNKNNYKVKTETGLGSLLVDGKKVSDNQVIGDGNSYIKVEAGVGEVRVNFFE